jgi:phosphoribosylformylglycinamidine synthase PurS subunit
VWSRAEGFSLSNYIADVTVMLKPVVNDPQGLVVRAGLEKLGFAGVSGVRVGKEIRIEIEAESTDRARAMAQEMCEKLLRNPVIEDYEIAIREAQPA